MIATAAVSTRKRSGPSPTATAPASANRASSSSVKSPSGPTRSKPPAFLFSFPKRSAFSSMTRRNGGAPAAARSATSAERTRSSRSSNARGGAIRSACARRHCLLAAEATRDHRPSLPEREASSSSSPSSPAFPASRLPRPPLPLLPLRSPRSGPTVGDRSVLRGTSDAAPSSALFSTSQSALPPFSPPHATTKCHSGPPKGAVATASSATAAAAASRAPFLPPSSEGSVPISCPTPTPPTPSHTSKKSPGFRRRAFMACFDSSRPRRTTPPAGGKGSST